MERLLLFLMPLILFCNPLYADDGTININKETNVLQFQKELENSFQKGAKYIDVIKDGDKKNKTRILFSPWWMNDIPLTSTKKEEYVNKFRILRLHIENKHIILDENKYGKDDLPLFKKYIEDKFQNNKLAFLLIMDKNVLVADIWNYLKFLYDHYSSAIAIVRIKDSE